MLVDLSWQSVLSSTKTVFRDITSNNVTANSLSAMDQVNYCLILNVSESSQLNNSRIR